MIAVPTQFDPKVKYFDTDEAAEALGISADTVKRYCNSDPPRIIGIKMGRSWAIPEHEIKRYLSEESELGRPKKAHTA